MILLSRGASDDIRKNNNGRHPAVSHNANLKGRTTMTTLKLPSLKCMLSVS